MRQRPGKDLVALILAVALFSAVVLVCISLLYAVIVNERRSVSDAANNLLTMLFGGIIAILGGYIGASMNGASHHVEKGEDDGREREQDEGRPEDRDEGVDQDNGGGFA